MIVIKLKSFMQLIDDFDFAMIFLGVLLAIRVEMNDEDFYYFFSNSGMR